MLYYNTFLLVCQYMYSFYFLSYRIIKKKERNMAKAKLEL